MRKALSILVAVAVTIGFAAAQGSPDKIHQFYGNLQIDGNPASSDAEVSVRSGGEVVGSIVTEDQGSYGDASGYGKKLVVQDVSQGDTLNFYVNGISAGEASFSPGEVTEKSLDLEVPEDEPVEVSQVAEPTPESGSVKVKVPEAAERDNSGVQSLNLEVEDSVDQVEVNVTVSESNIEDSGIEDEELEDTQPKNYIKVDTSAGNDQVESADIDLSLNKDSVDDPESVVILHFEDGERVGIIEPEYFDDQSEQGDEYLYSFETNSFSTFVAASDTEDPNAEIEDGDRTVDEGEEVQFDAGSSSDNTGVESYEWEFGDGETADGETASHTYDSSDEFTVALTVTDRAGNTDSTSIEVTVEDPPESSDFGNIGTDDEETETEEETQDEETQEDTSEDQTDETEQETDPEQQDQNQTETEIGNQTSETEDTQDQEQQSPATGLFTVSQTEGLGLGVIAVLALALITLQKTGRVDLTEIPEKVSELRSEEDDDSNPEYRFK